MENMEQELSLNELEQAVGGKNEKGYEYKPKAKKGCIIYRIQPGDKLGNIARAHNTTVEKIMKVNPPLVNANRIVAGFYLYIPVSRS